MKTIAGLVLAALLALAAPPSARAADGKIAVVAAENFYGDIARQIGGDRVTVVSIMNSPDQDPHLFETTPGIVQANRGRADRDLQRRRLRPLDGEAAGRGAAPGAPHDQRRRAHAPPSGRQSASVVRPVDHGRGRQALARRRSRQGGPRAQQRLRCAARRLRGLAQAAHRQDRRHPRQICRRRRHRQRAGVRLLWRKRSG